MPEDSTPRSIDELLDIIGNKDPRLRLLVEFIQRRTRNAAIEEDEEEEGKKDERNLDELKIHQLKREYTILAERNNLLASALGACPYCWGTDVTCKCHGLGRVASRWPDEEAFAELVLPVLKRLRIAAAEDSKKDNSDSTNKQL